MDSGPAPCGASRNDSGCGSELRGEQRMETRPFAARHSPFALLRLHRALHARVDRVQRSRAADIEPVALLAAETEIGDRFRNVDLADQLARRRVAANAVLTRIAPADGAPD